jgi:hypothetical protein
VVAVVLSDENGKRVKEGEKFFRSEKFFLTPPNKTLTLTPNATPREASSTSSNNSNARGMIVQLS